MKGTLPGFVTLKEALTLSREQNRENHRKFVNPEMVTLLGLINFDKMFVRAENCSVWDAEGEEYLDFLGGYGALNLGHNHPEIAAAVELARHTPNLLQAALNPLAGALARNLALVTPGDLQYCFFGNSGAEAVEGAIKLARAASGRKKIISCQGSFHGKSFGALSVTGREKYRKPFQPLLSEVEFVPYGQAEAVEKALCGRDAAVFIVEPVQGEGGIIVPPEGYLRQVREICSSYGTLLIMDEIQTGFGRTGTMFACEHEGVVPDIMCVAKSFGGGIMPLAAYIAKEAVWKSAYGSVDKATLHTSTFGGNSRAAAAGITALEVMWRENLAAQAAEKGAYVKDKLLKLQERYPFIREVRGRGLMLGLEFAQPDHNFLNRLTGGALEKVAQEYLGALVAGELMNKHHIITAYTLNNPNVIRLEPPLTVSFAQLDRMVQALEQVCEKNKGFGDMVLSSAKTVLGALFKRK
ncbi:aspartate aminotransferase family protein [Candidatus Formimonas warabiya]|uniref:Putrescine aminotransferase n=1 Tax=Formimonas warabiya TaxID=1761012 RepID=A0A3G1L1L2_FORW1|nr:aspartate aminotransferase family protein [Candidatus Formimonas warabiya]ATW28683.1 putrescine aminotransferase [Candidatus Formimonas warabiya]